MIQYHYYYYGCEDNSVKEASIWKKKKEGGREGERGGRRERGSIWILRLVFLRTHLTGAINHGYGVYCYIDLLTWPHDANLMINVLVDVLLKRDTLAPVLYLQLDNTARENKNQYVMAFLAYLVQAGIFIEV